MDTEATRQFHNVITASASATAGYGVTSISTSTTASTVDLYTSSVEPRPIIYNRFWTLQADGGDIYYTFSPSATTIDKTASATTFEAGTTAATPVLIKDGTSIRVRVMDSTLRYLCLQASSGTPKLRMWPSSQPAFTASIQH